MRNHGICARVGASNSTSKRIKHKSKPAVLALGQVHRGNLTNCGQKLLESLSRGVKGQVPNVHLGAGLRCKKMQTKKSTNIRPYLGAKVCCTLRSARTIMVTQRLNDHGYQIAPVLNERGREVAPKSVLRGPVLPAGGPAGQLRRTWPVWPQLKHLTSLRGTRVLWRHDR